MEFSGQLGWIILIESSFQMPSYTEKSHQDLQKVRHQQQPAALLQDFAAIRGMPQTNESHNWPPQVEHHSQWTQDIAKKRPHSTT